ncbi:MAG TPA: prenyltransferase/squalene oxidase repeat-containing protein [Acidimicrobiales bacterium]|nr:prenyltransferase/squalene oxidase repeat-containing protein [Acidimicrobiales bacterium]
MQAQALPPSTARAGLAASLCVVSEYLSPPLLPQDQRAALQRLAILLPPVHLGGFECRLGQREASLVDFQQGFRASDDASYLAGGSFAHASFDGKGWQEVRAFCSAWSEPGTVLHEAVPEWWLELDQADAFSPSVIALLGRTTGQARAHGKAAAPAILRLLAGASSDWPRALEALASACPAQAAVSHVGVMLAREPAHVRVNVAGIPLEELPAYLARAGWPGDITALGSLARELLVLGDRVVLCLDLYDGHLLARAGLECFLDSPQGARSRWRALLCRLVDMGLCGSAEADAVAKWPGRTVPPEVGDRWPTDLIARALREPPWHLSVIDRLVSHVKLSLSAEGNVDAKAYLGFEHVWCDARAQPSDPPAGPGRLAAMPAPAASVGRAGPSSHVPACPAPKTSASALRQAVERGARHLVAARNQAGWWCDFSQRTSTSVPAGGPRAGLVSDEWVTAYVACVLASPALGGFYPAARTTARHALDLLLARRPQAAGWGYNLLVPPDADSTSWVCRLAAALGRQGDPRYVPARGLVEGLVTPGGGVATYGTEAVGALAGIEGVESSFAGWRSAHTCVTAAAAALELDLAAGLLDFLEGQQQSDGSWSGYWWEDDEYATALACEALAAKGRGRERLERAAQWATRRLGRAGAVEVDGAGSAFATALAARTLITAPRRDTAIRLALQRAASWLVTAQREDGSWACSARLRIPGYDVTPPGTMPAVNYIDDKGLFTTATVLSALSAFSELADALR